MKVELDRTRWIDALHQPDWYLHIHDDHNNIESLQDEAQREVLKEEEYGLVEQALRENWIPLATSGDDYDAKRQPIDTIIIHHTKNPPGMRLERLNAMQLLRLYGAYYAHPKESHLRGTPVWSGHFYKGRQVFWAYHWLVRSDGSAERLLDDSYIGWHAGKWEVNTRSVALCVDDDLSEKEPTPTVLDALARIIHQHYGHVAVSRLLGHREVNPNTVCPGNLFLPVWKSSLIRLLEHVGS